MRNVSSASSAKMLGVSGTSFVGGRSVPSRWYHSSPSFNVTTRGQVFWLSCLVVAVILSGMGVVYSKFLSRSLFVELQQVRASRDHVDMEWGRLQLELATQGALGRVMRIANERLQMQVPAAEQIVVVK